jgi:hypothetical protein
MPMRGRVRFHFETVQTKGQIPNYPDLVWVQCKQSRCVAYIDATGQWINFYTGEKLTEFVKVIG